MASQEIKTSNNFWIKDDAFNSQVMPPIILYTFFKIYQDGQLTKIQLKLIGKRLYRLKNNKNQYITLNKMRLKKVEIENIDPNPITLYAFEIFNSKQILILASPQKNIYLQWYQRLEKLCRKVDFQQKFQKLKIIGKGSYGQVSQVRRLNDNKKFAAKIVKKQLSQILYNQALQLLQNQIQNFENIPQQLIPKLYQIYQNDKQIILVMEIILRGSLLQCLHQCSQSELNNFSKNIMKQLLLSLQKLHQAGYMHRDIKPQNLLIDKNNKVLFGDLGLACKISKQATRKCGTPGYIAPEILNSRSNYKYNNKVDIFSAGVVFYYLQTKGSLPFTGNFEKILKQNKQCRINIPQIVEQSANILLKGLLQKDPKTRLSVIEALNSEYFYDNGKQNQKIQKNFFEKKKNFGSCSTTTSNSRNSS